MRRGELGLRSLDAVGDRPAAAPLLAAMAAPAIAMVEADMPPEIELDGDADLADWLAVARDTVAAAQTADSRSRSALYAAVSRAWDFALAAEAQPQGFADLLDDAGLTVQDRAPMTPVVKLVFGATYDKTRLAEYACVLGHAREVGVERGGLATYLDRYPGGLKALVRDERSRKRGGETAPAADNPALGALRALDPAMLLPIAGDQEFVVLVARRIDADHVGLVASVDVDGASWAKLLAKAVPLAGD